MVYDCATRRRMKKMVVAGPGEGNEMDRLRTAEMEY